MNTIFDDLHLIEISEEYTRSYEVRYVAEIKHLGLGTYRNLKDKDRWILNNKIEAQFTKWDEQWVKVVNKKKATEEREANQNLADERTREAQEEIEMVENILHHTLNVDDTVDWESLKDKKEFSIPNPQKKLQNELRQFKKPASVVYRTIPPEPNRNDYQPKLSVVDKIFKRRGQKKIDQANSLYEKALELWESTKSEIETENLRLQEDYDRQVAHIQKQKDDTKRKYEQLEKEWEKQKSDYYLSQEEHNKKIDLLKTTYLQKDATAVTEYCELVLNNSEYPESFPKDFDLFYNPENKMLIVEYVLPAPENLPRLLEVKYVASKKELKESYITESQAAKMYDNTIYNITLRTLHELFEADEADAIEVIVFNGWVEAINKAIGKKVNSCIVSIQAHKKEFIEINLQNVDPKSCFKNLKGVGSSKLSGITAIQPITQINKNDKRFVSSYGVAEYIDEGYNLATMNWEDFEHLIRELFEAEFSSNGGEVKVTQASRDGGVDAVAFDPDPIRGGKIVIQAKRYTNTVGVSAVRDLYGTVMNEGATKGILVTTADFGPDAYEFIKNKPLTLLNGSNLLYLLQKHGHNARINIAEAKKANA